MGFGSPGDVGSLGSQPSISPRWARHIRNANAELVTARPRTLAYSNHPADSGYCPHYGASHLHVKVVTIAVVFVGFGRKIPKIQ